jgi:DNA-binding response OmpR family regulator
MTHSVLVIDDDPRIRQLICMGLERKGYTVFEAANGRAGLKAFDAHQPDLVITDILMPDIEGIETIMRLKRSARPPKIIAISGGGRMVGREFLRWARHLGADDVMAKPFRMSALVAMAQDLTGPGGNGGASMEPPPPSPTPLQTTINRPSAVITERWDHLHDRGHLRVAA